MRIVRNIGHVKRRRRIGRLAAFIGFLMLASTFFLVFFPTNLFGAYALLLVGFVAFNFGMQQMGKWANTANHPRNDIAIDARLEGFSDKYVALHYMSFGKKTVEHMLVYPGGVLVITARDVPGEIVARGDRWRRKGLGLTRMFGLSGPQLGNPSYETEAAIQAVEAKLKDAQLEYDVSGIILFTSPRVSLDVEDLDYPALELSELNELVRHLETDPTFKLSDRDALVEVLTSGEELERTEKASYRRPVKVKRRAPVKP